MQGASTNPPTHMHFTLCTEYIFGNRPSVLPGPTDSIRTAEVQHAVRSSHTADRILGRMSHLPRLTPWLASSWLMLSHGIAPIGGIRFFVARYVQCPLCKYAWLRGIPIYEYVTYTRSSRYEAWSCSILFQGRVVWHSTQLCSEIILYHKLLISVH